MKLGQDAKADADKANAYSLSIEELDLFIHISAARATGIVELRPFSSLDGLLNVSGIGPSRLADIKAQGVACIG